MPGPGHYWIVEEGRDEVLDEIVGKETVLGGETAQGFRYG
jgi:hypothetical protein